jgi:hypothetical protein
MFNRKHYMFDMTYKSFSGKSYWFYQELAEALRLSARAQLNNVTHNIIVKANSEGIVFNVVGYTGNPEKFARELRQVTGSAFVDVADFLHKNGAVHKSGIEILPVIFESVSFARC